MSGPGFLQRKLIVISISPAVMIVKEGASNATRPNLHGISYTVVSSAMPRSAARRIDAQTLILKDFCCVWIFYHRLGREDCARGSKALDPGGDVHSLPEIVLAVVEAHGETRSLVYADFEEKVLVAALGIDARHRLAHSQRSRKSAVRRGKCCHHGIPDRLDDRARFGCHNLVQHTEMLAHKVISDQIAHALIQCRRALEIGEQESEAGYLEPLIGVERVGVIKIAKRLVGEEPFRSKERPSLADKVMKRIAGDPERWHHSPVGVVLKQQAQRTGTQLHRT